MTTQEIANKLAQYCRQGDYEKAQRELYSEDIASVEPRETPGFDREERGLQKIIEKGQRFEQMVKEFHSTEVSEPIVVGNIFAFTLVIDMTMKEGGRRKLSELCVYEVKGDKIVSEHFFS